MGSGQPPYRAVRASAGACARVSTETQKCALQVAHLGVDALEQVIELGHRLVQ